MARLSIDEIIDLLTEQNRIRKNVNVSLTGFEFVTEYDLAQEEAVKLLKELKAYKDMEAQGIPIYLPFVFWELNLSTKTPNIYERYATTWGHYVYVAKRLGKTVFLTRKEATKQAVAHLKEMRKQKKSEV